MRQAATSSSQAVTSSQAATSSGQAVTSSTTYVMKEQEKKGLLVITPIIIGAVVYGVCNAYWLISHIVFG